MTENAALAAMTVAVASARPSEGELAAWADPPYPLPAPYAPFIEAATAALRERQQHEPDPVCTTRLLEPARPLSRQTIGRAGTADLTCLLLAGGLISVETAERFRDLMEKPATQAYLQRAIVYRLLADGDLPGAERAAAHPALGENQWVGWRAIGEHLAAAADAEGFLARWPRYKAQTQREGIARLREQLVTAVARRDGWQAAVALTADKRIGSGESSTRWGHVFAALHPIAEEGDVARLRELFATAPELETLDPFARLQLLADALAASQPADAETDHPEFESVFAEVAALDPTVSKEQSRIRDSLLVSLYPATASPATLKRLRAAVRSPQWKRELTPSR